MNGIRTDTEEKILSAARNIFKEMDLVMSVWMK